MSESLSRALLFTEVRLFGGLLLVATTVITLLAFPDTSSVRTPGWGWPLVGVAAMWMVLLSGWRLSRAFERGGVVALRQVHQVWWVVAAIGILVPVAYGVVLLILADGGVPFTPAPAFDDPFGLGPQSWGAVALPWLLPAPLALPLLHLRLEYIYRDALTMGVSGP